MYAQFVFVLLLYGVTWWLFGMMSESRMKMTHFEKVIIAGNILWWNGILLLVGTRALPS